ncbi:MAG: hypothetical protein R2874_03015 [Desulfobacterales bacterium]
MNIKQHTAQLLEKMRTTSPLIHNITNFVVMNSTANILPRPPARLWSWLTAWEKWKKWRPWRAPRY